MDGWADGWTARKKGRTEGENNGKKAIKEMPKKCYPAKKRQKNATKKGHMFELRLIASSNFFLLFSFFSRDEATLYEGVVCPSVRRSDGRSVTCYFFGLLGATNAVYTALFSAIL